MKSRWYKLLGLFKSTQSSAIVVDEVKVYKATDKDITVKDKIVVGKIDVRSHSGGRATISNCTAGGNITVRVTSRKQ